jgi:rhamnulokinase
MNLPARVPDDPRALVAIDLGAESCRVSLLRWIDGKPVITLVQRFANAPRQTREGLQWDLTCIEGGLMLGLRECADQAPEGIRSIAVDGWAVDYVRIDDTGKAVGDPFCYRDERTIAAEADLHGRCSPDRLRALTGVQLLRINTLYQLHADQLAASRHCGSRWLNLPEYILYRLGARPVAELTNATHSQMIGLADGQWSEEIFSACGFDAAIRPELVAPGTQLGHVKGELAGLAAYADTILIAPACHDTASAVAGIPASGDDWAYISSGTWSLVGTTLDRPVNDEAACLDNFTNLAAVGGRVLFHKNVNGMWLLRQCMDDWAAQGTVWEIADLIAAAETVSCPEGLLAVDDPELMLAGRMLRRINTQRTRSGFVPLDEGAVNAPRVASLILHSLAARYAEVLERVALHSGKQLKRLFVVGGGSQNKLLRRLTAEATGLEVIPGSRESSTIGNFAVQLASLECKLECDGVSAPSVSEWASCLQGVL